MEIVFLIVSVVKDSGDGGAEVWRGQCTDNGCKTLKIRIVLGKIMFLKSLVTTLVQTLAQGCAVV